MKVNSLIKILLVDDLPENLFALELILADKNYSFVRANSGNEALKILLHEQDFAIILMDVQMPEMDGFETVELIREIETLNHVPIIFLTASMDNAKHVFKGYQAGAVDYMIKPLVPEILTAKVAVFVELYQKTHQLLVQNEEKEKRADELVIANKELLFQDQEKGKRADELAIANKELVFQDQEKEKRADELIIANKELVFQNVEKEKRADELVIANKELIFQNEEKEKRAAELIITNKELESFNYISSHDLQEPLRKIQIFSTRLIADESRNLSDKGKEYVLRIEGAAKRMRTLIDDLLAYSRTTSSERKFKTTSLAPIIEAVKNDFEEIITAKQATIEVGEMCDAQIIPFQFHQLIHNLIGNALKFSNPDRPPHITINSRNIKGSKVKNKKLLSEKNIITLLLQTMVLASHHNTKTKFLRYLNASTTKKKYQVQE